MDQKPPQTTTDDGKLFMAMFLLPVAIGFFLYQAWLSIRLFAAEKPEIPPGYPKGILSKEWKLLKGDAKHGDFHYLKSVPTNVTHVVFEAREKTVLTLLFNEIKSCGGHWYGVEPRVNLNRKEITVKPIPTKTEPDWPSVLQCPSEDSVAPSIQLVLPVGTRTFLKPVKAVVYMAIHYPSIQERGKYMIRRSSQKRELTLQGINPNEVQLKAAFDAWEESQDKSLLYRRLSYAAGALFAVLWAGNLLWTNRMVLKYRWENPQRQ